MARVSQGLSQRQADPLGGGIHSIGCLTYCRRPSLMPRSIGATSRSTFAGQTPMRLGGWPCTPSGDTGSTCRCITNRVASPWAGLPSWVANEKSRLQWPRPNQHPIRQRRPNRQQITGCVLERAMWECDDFVRHLRCKLCRQIALRGEMGRNWFAAARAPNGRFEPMVDLAARRFSRWLIANRSSAPFPESAKPPFLLAP